MEKYQKIWNWCNMVQFIVLVPYCTSSSCNVEKIEKIYTLVQLPLWEWEQGTKTRKPQSREMRKQLSRSPKYTGDKETPRWNWKSLGSGQMGTKHCILKQQKEDWGWIKRRHLESWPTSRIWSSWVPRPRLRPDGNTSFQHSPAKRASSHSKPEKRNPT